MDEIEIKCPICGGHLQYWKEYIGDDRKTGKEIVIDFDKLPAKHICMFGNSGAGKIVVGYSTTHKTSNLIENTHILRSG